MHTTGVVSLLICWPFIAVHGSQTGVELTLSPRSSNSSDIWLSGDTVKICPNTTEVEFSCTAENVTELIWNRVRMNDMEEIFKFHVRTEPPFNTPEGYTAYLDNSTTIDNRLVLFSTITSRLRVGNSSNLIGGMIECRVFDHARQMLINESLRINLLNPPPIPSDVAVSVNSWKPYTVEDFVNISLMWGGIFNSLYRIIEYNINTSITSLGDSNNSSGVSCPPTCLPDRPCVCTGLLTRSGVNITVSAVNCGHQESPTKNIKIKKCQTETFGNWSNETDARCIDTVDSDNNYTRGISIPNGYVCYNGLTYGSIASFHCNEGYSVMGSQQTELRCELNGDWDGDTPTCEPFVLGWIIGLTAINFLTLIVSAVVTVIWSILFYRLDMSLRLLKLSIYVGILSVEVIVLLSALILWGVAVGSLPAASSFTKHRQGLTVSSFVLSVLALVWVSVNTLVCFARKRFSCLLFKEDDPIRIERDNELYYMGRSDCHEKQPEEVPNKVEEDEDRVYDRISCTSDFTDWDESCTDSEGYIKTSRQNVFLDPKSHLGNDAVDDFSYSV